MILEGCQGNKGIEIEEIQCPNCGELLELTSADIVATCEHCGTLVFSEKMNCVYRCSRARECVGDEIYQKMMAGKDQWQKQMEFLQDDDQW